jgi:hypothetical protein
MCRILFMPGFRVYFKLTFKVGFKVAFEASATVTAATAAMARVGTTRSLKIIGNRWKSIEINGIPLKSIEIT